MAVVAALQAGEVVSYGDVAAQAGYPGAGRAVGAVLAGASRPLPWWRIVYADGRLAPGKERDQERRLRAEGVEVRAGRTVVGPRPATPRLIPERARAATCTPQPRPALPYAALGVTPAQPRFDRPTRARRVPRSG